VGRLATLKLLVQGYPKDLGLWGAKVTGRVLQSGGKSRACASECRKRSDDNLLQEKNLN